MSAEDRPAVLGEPVSVALVTLDPRVREHVEQHGSHNYAGVDQPRRSEPADFGGGESTGVQQL